MTAQPTPFAASVRLGDPGDLIAAIPHLLGFHPVDSLIVLGLCPGDTARIGVTLRADLPPPEDVQVLARQLLLPLVERNLTAAALVVIGPDAPHAAVGPPRRDVVDACVEAFAVAGILVDHQLWAPSTADGASWSCYDCSGCDGRVPDPGATTLAAASAAAGIRTYRRREDIVRSLAPVAGDALARRTNLLEAISMAEPDRGADPAQGPRRLSRVQHALCSFAAGDTELTDEAVADLADALSDHRVRDACLDLRALWADNRPAGPADQDPDRVIDDPASAERLWTALMRATPGPERAESACLLAFAAHVRGDGVLAGIALEQAQGADPGHLLTTLLRDALMVGIAPARMWEAGVNAADYARHELSGEQL